MRRTKSQNMVERPSSPRPVTITITVFCSRMGLGHEVSVSRSTKLTCSIKPATYSQNESFPQKCMSMLALRSNLPARPSTSRRNLSP